MSKSPVQDLRSRLSKICLALPETSAEQTGRVQEHTTFRVRKKTFAYYLVNHHGDGRLALIAKGAPGARDALVASDPKRFFVPPYLGPSGWIGLDLDAAKVDWKEVAGLVADSYRLMAPKGLVVLVDAVTRGGA